MPYTILKLMLFSFLLLINLQFSLWLSFYFIAVPENHFLLHYIWMIPIYLILYAYQRLLTKRMVMSMEFVYLQKANFLALILITLILFASKSSEHYSRTIVLVFFLLNLFLPIWVYLLKRHFMQYDIFRENILAIYDTKGEEDINNWFIKDNSFGFNITKKIMITDIHDTKTQKKIQEAIDTHTYYAVIISLADIDTDKTFSAANYILHHVSRIYVLPKISKLPLINSEFFNSINHKGMALYIKNKLLHSGETTIKTIFDKIMSIFLCIFFSPVLIVLFIIVYLSSNGKPIYKQRRIGKDGKTFNIYKFRTMRIDADTVLEEILENNPNLKIQWEQEFKLKDDPRITKIGRFLRRTSLDELPQIFNVFQGKMSLVGPRPIIKDEIEKYGEYFNYFKAVKPGMTGLWQVSGRNDISYEERVRLDVWYVRNWSMELDIIILVKTAAMTLLRKGSY